VIEGVSEKEIPRQELGAGGKEAATALKSETVIEVFDPLIDWSEKRTDFPVDFLNSALQLEPPTDWLRIALQPIHQEFRERITEAAQSSSEAHHFDSDIEGWLKLIELPGDFSHTAQELRQKAFDTLLTNRKLEAAEEVLQKPAGGQTR